MILAHPFPLLLFCLPLCFVSTVFLLYPVIHLYFYHNLLHLEPLPAVRMRLPAQWLNSHTGKNLIQMVIPRVPVMEWRWRKPKLLYNITVTVRWSFWLWQTAPPESRQSQCEWRDGDNKWGTWLYLRVCLWLGEQEVVGNNKWGMWLYLRVCLWLGEQEVVGNNKWGMWLYLRVCLWLGEQEVVVTR